MKKKIIIIIPFFLIGFFIMNGLLPSSAVAETNVSYKASEVLVKFKGSSEVYSFKFAGDVAIAELIKEYQENPQVEYAEPNYLYQAQLEPLDTYFTQQTYLTYTQTNKAWNYTQGSPKVIIAVVDTGVDVYHPDLRQNIWKNEDEIANNGLDDDHNGFIDDLNGWDFLENLADPSPKFSSGYTKVGMNHGTVVAGVAAARGGNNEGIAGVSWYSKIMSLRCLDGAGIGDTLTVAKAIDYARENGAQIINLSFVGEGLSQTLTAAIERAYNAGILVVAAAGNEVMNGVNFDQTPMYPVCQDQGSKYNTVLGVGSLNDNDRKSSFSNFGTHCLDINAPGIKIFSTMYYNAALGEEFNKYYGGGWTGTSVAAPQVSGLAALIMSLKPAISLAELQKIILNNADNIDLSNKELPGKLGSGRINGYKAIAAAQGLPDETKTVSVTRLIVGAGLGGGPQVRLFENKKLISQFFAFDKNLRSGAKVTSGDLDGDGGSEVITASGPGSAPEIRVYDLLGNLKLKFLAYPASFKGGVNVTVGDINNDGREEIIVAPASRGGPHVRIFNGSGSLVGQFFAYDDKYRGGLSLATADLDQDKQKEIIVGLGAKALPLVKIYDSRGSLKNQFFAFDLDYQAGLVIAAGDVDNDRFDEIIVGALNNYRPLIKIFSQIGALKSEFLAYEVGFMQGVNLAVGDVDNDGYQEIIAGTGQGGQPLIKMFTFSGQVKDELYGFDKKLRIGVNVGVIN